MDFRRVDYAFFDDLLAAAGRCRSGSRLHAIGLRAGDGIGASDDFGEES